MDSWKLKFGRGGPPESRPSSSGRAGAALERWLRPPSKLSLGSMAVVAAVSDQSFDHAVFMTTMMSPEASVMEASMMELLELPAMDSSAVYRRTHASLQQPCNAGDDSGAAWHANAFTVAGDDDDGRSQQKLRSDDGASASTSYGSGRSPSLTVGAWGGHSGSSSNDGGGSSSAWDELDEHLQQIPSSSDPVLWPQRTQQQQTELSLEARKRLTAAIVSCADWQQLASIVNRHSGCMDHIHLSAALVKAAKLGGEDSAGSSPEGMAPGPSGGSSSSSSEGGGGGGSGEDSVLIGRLVDPGFCSLVEGLCGRLSRSVHLLGPRQVANALWSLSTLMPSFSRSAAAAEAAGDGRRGDGPRGSAAGRERGIDLDPEAVPLPRCPARSAARACQQAARRLALGMQPLLLQRPAGGTAVGVSVAGSSSNAGDVDSNSSEEEASCSPQALANTIWAMARLGLRPNDAWLASFLSLSAELLLSSGSGFRPRELSMTLWALATLRLWPGERWVAAVSGCILSGLRNGRQHAQAESHAGVERLGLQAEEHPGGGDGFGPQALANTMWAIARLKLPVPEPVLAELRGACLSQLPAFSAEQRSATLWALATMGTGTTQQHGVGVGRTDQPTPPLHPRLLPLPVPPPTVATGHAVRMAESAGGGAAVSELELLPPPRASPSPPLRLMDPRGETPRVCQPSAQAGPASSSSPAVSDSGVLLASPSSPSASSYEVPAPPCSRDALVSAIVACLHERMEGIQPRGLANAAWALARLDHRPTAPWTAQFLAVVGQSAGGLSTAGLCQLLWALNRCEGRECGDHLMVPVGILCVRQQCCCLVSSPEVYHCVLVQVGGEAKPALDPLCHTISPRSGTSCGYVPGPG